MQNECYAITRLNFQTAIYALDRGSKSSITRVEEEGLCRTLGGKIPLDGSKEMCELNADQAIAR